MNNNPFYTSLKLYWNNLFVKHDDKVEQITKAFAHIIVIIVLVCLMPTIGVLLSIFHTFDDMLKTTYNKLKMTKDEESKFPVLIELTIDFILWVPFVIIYIPLLFLKTILLACINNIWTPIALTVILASAYYFKANIYSFLGYKNDISAITSEESSEQLPTNYNSVNINESFDLINNEQMTLMEPKEDYALNTESTKKEDIESNILKEAISESEEEVVDEHDTPLKFIITSDSTAKLITNDSYIYLDNKPIIIPNKIQIQDKLYTVTTIGDFAFYGCLGITTVIIPSSINTIDHSAFENCTNLTEIIIPESVTTIRFDAFSGCKNLSLTINNSKENMEIGTDAFKDCKSITYSE